MALIKTDVTNFVDELGAGVFKEKLAHILSDVALGVITHGGGKKTGKVTVEFHLAQLGENEQVIIAHKLGFSVPTKRGKRSEEDVTDSTMFVGKGGRMTVDVPKEENSGQFALVHGKDGV